MKYYATFILVFLFVSAKSQNQVKINGICPQLTDGTELSFQLTNPSRNTKITSQTTRTFNHQFTFIIPAVTTEAYHLYLKRDYYRMYLEPGTFSVYLPDTLITNAVVKGSQSNAEFQAFYSDLDSHQPQKTYRKSRIKYFKYLEKAGFNNDSTKILQFTRDSLGTISGNDEALTTIKFIDSHPNSVLNSYLLYRQIKSIPEPHLRKIINGLPPHVLENSWGKELRYHADSLFIGGTAPGFSQTNTLGKEIALKSYKGKYVLIDFWASWCIPCRAEYPVIRMAYKRYAAKNFTVLGVSLDKDKEKWIKAIRDDQLHWENVSDFMEFNNSVALKYYVSSIPANFLIDPSGKIIAKNLRGEDLINKLAEIFK